MELLVRAEHQNKERKQDEHQAQTGQVRKQQHEHCPSTFRVLFQLFTTVSPAVKAHRRITLQEIALQKTPKTKVQILLSSLISQPSPPCPS